MGTIQAVELALLAELARVTHTKDGQAVMVTQAIEGTKAETMTERRVHKPHQEQVVSWPWDRTTAQPD